MKNDGNICTSGYLATVDDVPQTIKYRQVGTIQLMRGNRFVISLDEHRLPEGTRALYVRESVGPTESDSATNSRDDSGDTTTDLDSW